MKGTEDFNWYDISARAFTAIRQDWPVAKLELMALDGHETPVCGDTMRNGL